MAEEEKKTEKKTSSQTLTVLSYNLGCHWFSPNDLPKAFERLTYTAAQIAEAQVDVVLVQEVYTLATPWPFGWGRELASFQKQLAAVGLIYHIGDGQGPWVGMDSGLQIFSRYPLVSVKSNLWAKTFAPARGHIVGRVCLPEGEGEVYVVNLHLEAKNAQTRKAQLLSVSDTASKLAGEGHTVLVGGDFNHTVRELPGAPTGAFVALAPPGVSTHCHDEEIDQIFITSAAYHGAAEVVQWQTSPNLPVSDHYGLLASVLSSSRKT